MVSNDTAPTERWWDVGGRKTVAIGMFFRPETELFEGVMVMAMPLLLFVVVID